jgi:hypothetical protein
MQAKYCSFIVSSVLVLTSAHSVLNDLIIHTVLDDVDIVSSWSRYLPCFSVAYSVLNPSIFRTIMWGRMNLMSF